MSKDLKEVREQALKELAAQTECPVKGPDVGLCHVWWGNAGGHCGWNGVKKGGAVGNEMRGMMGFRS